MPAGARAAANASIKAGKSPARAVVTTRRSRAGGSTRHEQHTVNWTTSSSPYHNTDTV